MLELTDSVINLDKEQVIKFLTYEMNKYEIAYRTIRDDKKCENRKKYLLVIRQYIIAFKSVIESLKVGENQ